MRLSIFEHILSGRNNMQKVTPPLEFLQRITKKYSRIWDYTDRALTQKANGELSWSDLCYLPIYDAGTILMQEYGCSIERAAGLAGYISALAAWRQDKRIYQFTRDLTAELVSHYQDIDIPVEIFRHMPAKCIYISFPYDKNEEPIDGFFAWIEHDVSEGKYEKLELRLLYVSSEGKATTQFIIHLQPHTNLSDGIDEAISQMRKNAQNEILMKGIEDFIQSQKTSICQVVQLLLYVCAENADIIEDEEQRKIYNISTFKIRDKYREIRKYNVGVSLSKAIQIKKKEGSPKASHVRRAHWHHYWVGTGNNRTLILRWLSPMLINAKKQ